MSYDYIGPSIYDPEPEPPAPEPPVGEEVYEPTPEEQAWADAGFDGGTYPSISVSRLWQVMADIGVIENGTWVSFEYEDAKRIAAEYNA